MVLVSLVVPPNLGDYINLSTTSTRLKTLWTYLNVITNITYLMNYVTVMLNKSLGKTLIRFKMASVTSLLWHHDRHVMDQHPHLPADGLTTPHHDKPNEPEVVDIMTPAPLPGGTLHHHEEARQYTLQHDKDTTSTR